MIKMLKFLILIMLVNTSITLGFSIDLMNGVFHLKEGFEENWLSTDFEPDSN